MPATPEIGQKWIELADRYGLPLVFLFVTLSFLSVVVWALWRAFKPHLDKLLERHVTLMDTATSCLQTLTGSVGELKENHGEILTKLDGVAAVIKESDKQCRQATAEARKETREDIKAFYTDSRAERKEDRGEHSTHWIAVREALHRLFDHMQGKQFKDDVEKLKP